MSLASRRWGLADGQGKILPDGLRFVKRVRGRCLDRQALHLLGGVPGAEQAAFASQELHGLEEACADGAACNGEAQGVYQAARALLPFGGEATYRLLYRGLRPLGKCREAFDELGEVFPDKLLAELFFELGLVVVEGAAVEVADGVGDLGRQGDALLQEIHDVLEACRVPIELLLRRRARLDEHGGGKGGQFLRALAAKVDGVHGPELLLVEDRWVAAHAVDAEAFCQLIGGEDLLVSGVAGAEEREVVEERLGQVALLCEVLNARRAVALAELLLVWSEDLGDVGEGWERVA